MMFSLRPKRRAKMLIAVITSAGLLTGCQASARTQEPRAPKGEILLQQEGGRLLFDPEHQKLIRYQDQQISIQLEKQHVKPGEGWRLSVLIQSKAATPQRIPLPHEMAQVNEIRLAAANKAIIVGMINGDAWAFAVLDLQAFKLIDTVWCYDPAVSPNGRYVAFIKFFPTHFVPDVEDHYMLYNLALSPVQNRPPGSTEAAGRIFQAVNAGTPVYPPGIGNGDGDNTDVPPERAHFIASEGFFWRPDSGAFIFADRFQGKLDLVMAQLETDQTKPAISRAQIPLDKLCASLHKTNCEARLTTVHFQLQQVSAIFRGSGPDASLHENLPLPYALFHHVR